MKLGLAKLMVFVFDEKTKNGNPIYLSARAVPAENLGTPYFTGDIGTDDLLCAADFLVYKHDPEKLAKRKDMVSKWFKGHFETVTIDVAVQPNEN